MLSEWFSALWQWLQTNWQGLIATLAFVVTVFEVHATRRHNRLSVLPHLDTISFANEGDRQARISIRNGGVGPARINKIVVYRDGELVTGKTTYDAFLKACNEILKNHPNTNMRLSGPDPGSLLAANTTENIATWTFAPQFHLDINQLRGLLERLDFEIHYSSLYGQSMPPLDTRIDRGKKK